MRRPGFNVQGNSLLTVAEVASLLKLSPKTVRKIKGKIGYSRIGGRIRFAPAAVQRYVDACTPKQVSASAFFD